MRRALGITAGNHDLCAGVFAMDAPDRGAGVLVRGGSHRAGIEHHNFGFRGRTGRRQTLRGKLALQGGPVRLRGAATKALYKKSRHSSVL